MPYAKANKRMGIFSTAWLGQTVSLIGSGFTGFALGVWVFEPLLLKNGRWTGSLGRIIGTGPGRGLGLIFILMGLIKIGVVLAAYLKPDIRYIEDSMPDALPFPPEDNPVKIQS